MGFAMLLFQLRRLRGAHSGQPELVISIPARWDGGQYVPDPNGPLEPICEACARQLKARFERRGSRFRPSFANPTTSSGLHEGAHESDL